MKVASSLFPKDWQKFAPDSHKMLLNRLLRLHASYEARFLGDLNLEAYIMYNVWW